MTEKFNPEQIDTLRREYGKIERIDPCAPTYDKLIATLNAMSQDQLKQVHAANIRFISKLAANRIKRAA